ncbi:aminotransferase class IV [Paenirhodobacter sp.]|uniref:aminotransferase class IV n=1 Tax=Paenirhodobacter sp. TaxID=1965326 RepID=UPI003B3D9951
MQGGLCGDLRLIETLLWDGGPVRLSLHQARLARGCAALGVAVPDLVAVLAGCSGRLRVRVTVDLAGRVEVTRAPFVPETRGWRAVLAEGLDSTDPWRGLKTTERAIYDRTRAALPPGVDEAVLLNERGEVADGTITNVFVAEGAGWLTPSLTSGCLPGVLRADLLARGLAREAVLRPADLRGGFHLGNSLRGLIAARLV